MWGSWNHHPCTLALYSKLWVSFLFLFLSFFLPLFSIFFLPFKRDEVQWGILKINT